MPWLLKGLSGAQIALLKVLSKGRLFAGTAILKEI
jgi:hypothetical protein